jgi:hypothetical protein
MSNVHMIVGSLVVLGYLIVLIFNLRTFFTGSEFTWQRPLTFGAATLLVVQYMLGFSLLGSGEEISAWHFVFALLALLPLGLEHAFASTRETARGRGMFGSIANILTLALVLTAYIIGQSN